MIYTNPYQAQGELGRLKKMQQGCLGQFQGYYSSEKDTLVCVTVKFRRISRFEQYRKSGGLKGNETQLNQNFRNIFP
jgi:hypothetical protein